MGYGLLLGPSAHPSGLGMPIQKTCEQDAKEKLWQAAGPHRAVCGELLTLLCCRPHAHQGSRAAPTPSCCCCFGADMGASVSDGVNQGKTVSFSHQHGLGLPSWPQHLPPSLHSMSRASSVSISETKIGAKSY